MAELPDIPPGYGIPLVDLDTGLLPDPTMEAISDIIVSEIADEPTVAAAAAEAVDAELDTRDLVQRELGDSEDMDIAGGLSGDNGRATDLVVTAGGEIPASVMGRWYTRLLDLGVPETLSVASAHAAGGLVGENNRALLLFNDDGTLTDWTVSSLRSQLLNADAQPNLIDLALNGNRKLRGTDGAPFVSDAALLAAWGDSLTEGWPNSDFGTTLPSPQSWPNVLDGSWAGAVFNGGKTGQSADEIAIRQGGYMLTVQGFTIPTSGGVTVVEEQVFGWRLDRVWACVGTLGGVHGTLSRAIGGVLTFTRTASGAATVIAAGTPFISEQGELHKADVHVIFAGRNDIGYSSPGGDIVDRVVAATVAMVERSGVQHRRTLLVGTTTATGELAGSTNHTHVTAINTALASIYPDRFFDLRAYLVNDAIHDLGITPTATDLSRMAGDTLPPSIMAVSGTDSVHYSVATAALVAAQIKAQLQLRDWII